MEQSKKIEMFLNWLMDNNFFMDYYHTFMNKFKVREFSYTFLLKRLKETNYQDFVSIICNETEMNDFTIDIMKMSWEEYYSKDLCNNTKTFEDGDYIKYSVIRYGVKTDYISIIEICEDGFVSEYCSAVMNSDDEDLQGRITYYNKFDIDEAFYGFRLANKKEIKWMDKHLEEYNGVVFNKEKKELIELA